MKVVTTLPISPRLDPLPGFFTIPVVVDVLAKSSGYQAIQAINLFGDKPNGAKALGLYRKILDRLLLSTDLIWLDSEHLGIPELILEGCRNGWVNEKEATSWVCACGKTEILQQAEGLLFDDFAPTTYELVNERPHCKLCGTSASLKTSQHLLLQLPEVAEAIPVQPHYAAIEINNLQIRFSRREISISRERETGLSLVRGRNRYHLDPDVTWMLFLALVNSELSCSIEALVVGHKTLKHALLGSLVSQQVTGILPRLIVALPYVKLHGQKATVDMERLLDHHSGETLRCLLSFVLGSKSKELVLPSETIYWIEHSLRMPLDIQNDIRTTNPSYPPEEIWRAFSRESMNNLLAKLRRKQFQRLTTLEKLVLRGVLV